MAFPNINFKITNANVGDELKAVVASKLSSLEKFIGEAPSVCDFEFERVTNHHQQGNIHRVEINLEVNGKLFRAETTEETFEKAIDKVRHEIEEGLRRASNKENTLFKKGSRKLKEMLHLN
jgi:ribosomal subunit interface protein